MRNLMKTVAIAGFLACAALASPARALPMSPAASVAPKGRDLVELASHKPPHKKKSERSKEKHARHKAERRERERRYDDRSRSGVHLHIGDDRSRHYRNDRYRDAPYGWWRYRDRPPHWKKRGCALIGPDWY